MCAHQRAHPPQQRTQVGKHLFAGDKGLLCLCHVSRSPRRTPAPIARFPARRGKLFLSEAVMLGTASRSLNPPLGQPDTPPSPPSAAVQAELSAARPRALGRPETRPAGAGGGAELCCAASRRFSPLHRPRIGRHRPLRRGDPLRLQMPPTKLVLTSRAGSPRPPPTAPAGLPSLTWQLPGRSLTASGGGARRSRGCLCRHLHSPLPR